MPKLTLAVYALDGSEVQPKVELDPSVFAVAPNKALVSEVIVSAQANRRHAIGATKNRAAVSGGGRKPWRQKGTGRARAGSTRSPLWRHGGVVFGPTSERNFSRKINQKARTAVGRMLLSALREADQLRIVDRLSGEVLPTTKQAAAFLNQSATSARRPLVLTSTADEQLLRSFRNLGGVSVRSLERLSVLDLITADQLIVDRSAIGGLSKRYTQKSRELRAESRETSDNSPLTSHLSTLAKPKPLKREVSKKSSKRAAQDGGLHA